MRRRKLGGQPSSLRLVQPIARGALVVHRRKLPAAAGELPHRSGDPLIKQIGHQMKMARDHGAIVPIFVWFI